MNVRNGWLADVAACESVGRCVASIHHLNAGRIALPIKSQLEWICTAIDVEPVAGDTDEGFWQDVSAALVPLDNIGHSFVSAPQFTTLQGQEATAGILVSPICTGRRQLWFINRENDDPRSYDTKHQRNR